MGKECVRGVDFPCWFIDGLTAIDRHLHLIWHEYQILSDTPMTRYEGSQDDPRFVIHEAHGHTHFGFLPTDRKDNPLPEQMWHIWWFRPDYGWCHVMPVLKVSEPYLKLVLDRLHAQATLLDTSAARHYVATLREREHAEVLKMFKAQQERFMDTTRSNRKLIQTAADNLGRGIINPTNPQKDVIQSFAGQTHRSRLRVPVGEKEGGLHVEGD